MGVPVQVDVVENQFLHGVAPAISAASGALSAYASADRRVAVAVAGGR
jgi:hypothetical protein